MRDPLTPIRMAALAASGFRDVSELVVAVLTHQREVGKELLEGGSLSEQQTRGVRATLNDTPAAFAALEGLPLPVEEKENLIFRTAVLIDDSMTMGAFAALSGDESLKSLVSQRARAAGLKSAETRRTQQKAWRDLVLTEAGRLLEKNRTLTQDELATLLHKRWPKGGPRLPGRREIIAFLSQAVNDGRLPKRTG
jgi:hypothetical protein